ncbi:DNA-binding protein [Thiocapsa roseopersicina]|uniref:Putative transposase n=1 Tax=Thiocapsa roseopersicina TaxID=1058 RepID=A0A1H3CP69_THIRO|nr:DNA-binding protein [Thiocapsa roseopersicina]SDX55953.1 putative transposase [Thiocapsa roseopersicina]
MRNWYAISDLAGLPGMPGTVQGVLKMAKREGWKSRKRARGKGQEYAVASLPAATQEALISSAAPKGAAKSLAMEDLIARECRESGVWAAARRVLAALWRRGRHA